MYIIQYALLGSIGLSMMFRKSSKYKGHKYDFSSQEYNTINIEDKTSVSFGGRDEKNRNMGAPDNILTIVGNVSFAGVEIIYI